MGKTASGRKGKKRGAEDRKIVSKLERKLGQPAEIAYRFPGHGLTSRQLDAIARVKLAPLALATEDPVTRQLIGGGLHSTALHWQMLRSRVSSRSERQRRMSVTFAVTPLCAVSHGALWTWARTRHRSTRTRCSRRPRRRPNRLQVRE
jgi:hypothetical protein